MQSLLSSAFINSTHQLFSSNDAVCYLNHSIFIHVIYLKKKTDPSNLSTILSLFWDFNFVICLTANCNESIKLNYKWLSSIEPLWLIWRWMIVLWITMNFYGVFFHQVAIGWLLYHQNHPERSKFLTICQLTNPTVINYNIVKTSAIFLQKTTTKPSYFLFSFPKTPFFITKKKENKKHAHSLSKQNNTEKRTKEKCILNKTPN